jgi:tetratricopeptide (TPR) repeat protein
MLTMPPPVRRLGPCLALSLALFLAAPAQANSLLKDAALQRLWDQGQLDTLQRELQGRSGPDVLVAQSLLDNVTNDKAALARAVATGQACVQQHPNVAACHHVLGAAWATQAVTGGLLKGLSLVGRVREALSRALALDPSLLEARNLLQTTYLALPAMAGGSPEKARALEAEVRNTQPELAKLLRANLAAKAERWDDAERELASVKLEDNAAIQNLAFTAWGAVSRQWMKTDQHAKARERFAHLAKAWPQHAEPVYLQGRLAADEGRPADALKLYERARALNGAVFLPLDFRAALAYLELGDKDQARTHLQRAVANKRGNPNNVEDARKRLQALG